MKHTPGPWIIDRSHKVDRDGTTIWADDVIIADCVPDQHENHKANAHLIAAAPDLLEAMKELFKQCAMTHKHWGDGCNNREATAAIKAARAAIAKAE
jgi:hypothetical protein